MKNPLRSSWLPVEIQGKTFDPRITRNWLYAWFGALLILKLLLVFIVFPAFVGTGKDYQGAMFPDQYDLIAENLLSGYGYRIYPDTSPTLLRTPGHVLLLAAIFSVFGKSLLAVQAVNFLLATGTAWLVFLLVRRLGGSPVWAMGAASISLIHPGMIMAETRGGLESLLSFVLVALVYCSYIATASGRLRHYVALGVIFGIALLVKSSVAVILPLMAAASMIASRSREQALKQAVGFSVAVLVGLVVLSPWVARNYVISGQFVPTMTVGGLAIFQGLYVVENKSAGRELREVLAEAAQEQDRIAKEMGKPYRPGFFPQFFEPQHEIAYYNELGRQARDRMLDQPLLALRAIAQHSFGFWFQGRTGQATLLNIIVTMPFLILTIVGLLLALRANIALGLIMAAILAYIAPHLPILGMARYYIPIVPLMAIAAAYPLEIFRGQWASKQTEK